MKIHLCIFAGCAKQFPCRSKLADHINVHMDIRPYGCDICDKKYTSKKHLNAHFKTHSTPTFACEWCSRTFTYKIHLNRHKLICKRIFYCIECNRKYIRMRNYEKHMLAHNQGY